MRFQFQLRRGLAAEWTAVNPVLHEGEPGVELDTLKLKIGDGATAWNALDYIAGEGGGGTPGADGADGLSAYQVALANGFVGTQAEWLDSLIGDPGANGVDGVDGADGLSAYQIAVANGFVGTEAAWLASLVGPEGPEGPEGPQGDPGSGGGSTAWADITGKPATFPPTIGATGADAVAGNDARLTDARTPVAHVASHQNGGADELNVGGLSGQLADAQPPIIGATGTTAVAGNDARLTNARTPTAHAASHANGGADEVSVAGLSGLLADGQTPLAHAASHQNGAGDEVNVGGLSGVLTDPQPPIIGAGAAQAVAGNDARLTDARTPTLHAASHQNGGADEISVAGLSGLLADTQKPIIGAGATDAVAGNDARLTNARTPTAHAASHQNGGADEISVAGLSGVLADPQSPIIGATGVTAVAGNDARLTDARTPTAHAASHQNGGADEISVAGLSGVLADPQKTDTIKTTTGPTDMVVGAVADGHYLKQVGATIVGDAGSGGGGSPGGADTEIQFNNAGAFDGSPDLTWDDTGKTQSINGKVQLDAIADPAVSPADSLYLWAKKVAGRLMLKLIGPAGFDYPLQPSLFAVITRLFRATTGSAITGGYGFSWSAALGTATTPGLATTAPAIINAAHRVRFVSATTANAGAGLDGNNTFVWRGNAAGLGGFFFSARFADVTGVGATRLFVGLCSGGVSMIAGEPSASAGDFIGIGHDTTDANYVIMSRNNVATTKTAMSTPLARAANVVLEVILYCPPNAAFIHVRVLQISTTGTVTVLHDGQIAATLPRDTIFFEVQMVKGVAAAAVAQTFDIMNIYLESDY